ncbi:RRP15-like protein [Osmerus eperlanus]|uniref:RRP15-like protein n=1 Tax=Osmerus eperlanus TaxID=29151 RepID=UPI002E101B7E
MATVKETHVRISPELLGDAEHWKVPSSSDNASAGESDGEEEEEGGSDGGLSEDERSERNESDDGGKEGESEGGQAEEEDGGSGLEVNKNSEEEGNPNAGWAEAMAKILQKKTPASKPSILLKNKQLDRRREQERKEQLERKKQVEKRRAWEEMCRQKPDVVKDRESERSLQRIATRGVVQLFNAVRSHQKTLDEKVKEAGGSERKKAKLLSSVSRRDFISVLRGAEAGGGAAGGGAATFKHTGAEEKPVWSVLRDDYMMGASMKDWDKESEEDGVEAGGGGDYNSGSD